MEWSLIELGRSGTRVWMRGGTLMRGTDTLTTKDVHNSCYGDGILAINNELKVGCYCYVQIQLDPDVRREMRETSLVDSYWLSIPECVPEKSKFKSRGDKDSWSQAGVSECSKGTSEGYKWEQVILVLLRSDPTRSGRTEGRMKDRVWRIAINYPHQNACQRDEYENRGEDKTARAELEDPSVPRNLR